MRRFFLGTIIFLFSIGLYSNIKFTPNQIFVGHEITFSVDQHKSCTNCKWDFGDGTIINNVAAIVPAKHTFTKSGEYTVTFTYGGCIETPPPKQILILKVLDNRTITIQPQNPKVHDNIKIEFKNPIKTPIQWDFGDGTKTSGDAIIYHTYQNSGNYTITAKDSIVLNTYITYNIQISQDNRSVTYTPKSPMVNDNINFTALSFKKDNLKWDFGDGTIQNGGSNISHKYLNPGNYHIKVYDFGGNDNYPITLDITISKDMRNITYFPKQVFEGQNIKFTANQFKSSNLKWDFGDGTKKTGPSNIIHYYRRKGNYTIKVYDNGGNDNNPITTKISVMRDRRKISWTPKTPFSKEPVKFKLLSVNSNDFSWRFGDGTKKRGNGTEILHTYNREGTFTVKVFDTKRQYETPIIAKITILKDPRKLKAKPRIIYAGEKAKFEALSFKSSSLLWDFGDGIKKTDRKTVIHKYKNQGIYTLKVRDNNGADKKTFSLNIKVLPDPRKLELSTTDIRAGKEIEVKAINFYSNTILWDFGDGIRKTDTKTVKHIYRKAGVFVIKAIDYAGKDDKIFNLSVNVKISPSQATNLMVSGGEIFFKNNYKNFIIVPKDYKGIKAIAKIKFEGTGNLLAYWSIDGYKYLSVNKNLSFGQNNKFIFKNIPTLLIGLHKITFSVFSPKTDFELNGYYFVSPAQKKIKLVLPEDSSNIKVALIKFKWEKINLKCKYVFRLSSDIKNLFKNPEIKKTTLGNTRIIPVKKLKKGKKYYWFVEAKDSSGNVFAISDIRSFKTKR